MPTIKVKMNPAKKKKAVKKKTISRKPPAKKVTLKRMVKKNPADITASERLFLRKLLKTVSKDYEFTGRDKRLIEGLMKRI